MDDVMENRDERYGLLRFAKTREEFDRFYEEQFVEDVEALEDERKKQVKQLYLLAGLSLVGFLLVLVVLRDYWVFYWIVLGPALFQYYRTHQKNLDRKLKEEMIPNLVSFMHDSFEYKPNARIPFREFQKANIFNRGLVKYRGEDFISGTVLDEEFNWKTHLSFSEVRLTELSYSRDDKGRRRKSEGQDIVRGLFFKVDFNKRFDDAVTTIIPRFMTKSHGKIMVDFAKEGMEEVELEDLDFMEEFAVYSTDQVMARVILQADMMQRIYEFTSEFRQMRQGQVNGEDLSGWSMDTIKKVMKEIPKGSLTPYIPYITFRGKHLYLLFDTGKDHFSVPMFTPFTNDIVYQYFTDINRGLQLIDDLNLNLKLYVES